MAKHNQNGAMAENRAADYLRQTGYKIIGQNWKTKWCEIDVIARKDACIYFVEVKYRSSAGQGNGYDYITRAKLRKMDLAARSWVEISNWPGEYTLSAAEVSGPDYKVNFLEDIIV